jgi:uncharacterized protein YegL/CheY-like chemotaxis protein
MKHLVVDIWWPLVALVVALPFVVWFARRSLSPLSARHRVVLGALRAAAIACVAVALMRPSWLGESTDVSVVYALDVSKSVDPAFIDAAIRWMDKARAQDGITSSRFVAFADRPRFVDSPEAIRGIPLRTGRGGSPDALDPLVTDVERALETVAGAFEPDALKRVVLMTDGNATRGDAWRTLDRLRARGVRVFPVPALVRPGNDAWIAGIDLPPELRRDEPARVAVRVQAQSAGSARVKLLRGSRVLGQSKVTLVAGENVVPFTVRIAEEGATSLGAEVAAEGDTLADNDRFVTPVRVEARPRVLVVEGSAEAGKYLRESLSASGFAVQGAAPEAVPSDAKALDAFDAVVLSDVPAPALGKARMEALATYAEDHGGGLVFAAGASAYGEGGYRESPLERVLPVTFEAQEKRRELALVIVLDRSYSMKGRKLDLAKAATLGALDLLEEEHRFGVITFDSQPEMTVPLAQVRSKRKAEDLISRFTASGQTNIYPALQMAYRMLVDVPVKSKHVILMSDGDTQPADFQRLTKRMADAQITVTTVAIGAEADRKLLGEIADWGRGRFPLRRDGRQRAADLHRGDAAARERERPRGTFPRRREAQGRGARRHRLRAGADAEGPREREAEGPRRGLARVRGGCRAARALADRARSRRRVRFGCAQPLGGRLARLARLRQVLEPDRARDDAASRPGIRRLRDRRADRRRDARAAHAAGRGRRVPQRPVAARPRVERRQCAPRTVAMRQSGPGRYELRWPADPAATGATRFELVDGVPAGVAASVGAARNAAGVSGGIPAAARRPDLPRGARQPDGRQVRAGTAGRRRTAR